MTWSAAGSPGRLAIVGRRSAASRGQTRFLSSVATVVACFGIPAKSILGWGRRAGIGRWFFLTFIDYREMSSCSHFYKSLLRTIPCFIIVYLLFLSLWLLWSIRYFLLSVTYYSHLLYLSRLLLLARWPGKYIFESIYQIAWFLFKISNRSFTCLARKTGFLLGINVAIISLYKWEIFCFKRFSLIFFLTTQRHSLLFGPTDLKLGRLVSWISIPSPLFINFYLSFKVFLGVKGQTTERDI